MILEDFLQRFGAWLPEASGAAVLVAIVAGVLASAVCPCTLPVGIGLATAAGGTESQERRSGLLVALAFFVGIVANLTLLGAVAGRLGAILTESFGRYWALSMAVFSLVAALVAFWGPRVKGSTTRRFAASRNQRRVPIWVHLQPRDVCSPAPCSVDGLRGTGPR